MLAAAFIEPCRSGDASDETGHLPGCAFAPGQAGTPCLHTHDQACGYCAGRPEAAEPSAPLCEIDSLCFCADSPCAREDAGDQAFDRDPAAEARADDGVYDHIEADSPSRPACPDDCTHDALCGCLPDGQASPCLHIHDASCGYTPPQAEIPCTCAEIAAAMGENAPMPGGEREPSPAEPTDATEPEASGGVAPAAAPLDDEPDGGSGGTGSADLPDGGGLDPAPDREEAGETPHKTAQPLIPDVPLPEQAVSAAAPPAPPLDENATDQAAYGAETAETCLHAAGQARQNPRDFFITIPGSLTLCSGLSEISIAVDGVADGETILLTFYSENGFQLTDGTAAVPYSMFLNGRAVYGGAAYPCAVSGGRVLLQMEMGRPRFAGNYSDTLRFAISLPSAAEAEQPEPPPAESQPPETVIGAEEQPAPALMESQPSETATETAERPAPAPVESEPPEAAPLQAEQPGIETWEVLP